MVTELAGLGPAPFCGMILADLGARVIKIDRPGGVRMPIGSPATEVTNRGKYSIVIDLKIPAGVDVALRLIAGSDVLIEGFRPGVAERLGLGPAQALARNHSLVFARMTGWGQDGPMSSMAGHDIDYIAVSGALHGIGPQDKPVPPLNLVGDFGGGGMLLAVGILAALVHVGETGEGQVVDASMVDGSALLMASHHGYMAEGWWVPRRESNLLDGGAPFYGVYETSEGGHVAVGALEPQFFAELIDGLGLSIEEVGGQNDRAIWPAMRELFAARFLTRTRDEWAAHFEGSDGCVAPVLSMSEAPDHVHNRTRGTFIELDGVRQPGPAPRFSATPPIVDRAPSSPGHDTDEVLNGAGFSRDEIGKLRASGAIT